MSDYSHKLLPLVPKWAIDRKYCKILDVRHFSTEWHHMIFLFISSNDKSYAKYVINFQNEVRFEEHGRFVGLFFQLCLKSISERKYASFWMDFLKHTYISDTLGSVRCMLSYSVYRFLAISSLNVVAHCCAKLFWRAPYTRHEGGTDFQLSAPDSKMATPKDILDTDTVYRYSAVTLRFLIEIWQVYKNGCAYN